MNYDTIFKRKETLKKNKDKLDLLLKFGSSSEIVGPDPFYGGISDFELVLDLVEDACEGFLEHVISSHSLS